MGGHFQLQNGQNKLHRVWPTGPRSKKVLKLIIYDNLMLLMIFNICSHFLENAFFRIE